MIHTSFFRSPLHPRSIWKLLAPRDLQRLPLIHRLLLRKKFDSPKPSFFQGMYQQLDNLFFIHSHRLPRYFAARGSALRLLAENQIATRRLAVETFPPCFNTPLGEKTRVRVETHPLSFNTRGDTLPRTMSPFAPRKLRLFV